MAPATPQTSGGLGGRVSRPFRGAIVTESAGACRSRVPRTVRDSLAWHTTIETRGVHKLDLPCKNADSAATGDVTAYGTDQAEKLRG
jgi:hypothetical protein